MSADTRPADNIKPIAIRRQRAPLAPVAHAEPTPLDIVQAALATGNVEMYREAVALMKEMDAFAARKAFDKAMSDAKAQIPVIRKNRRVGFEHKNGTDKTEYSHEDMAEIARTVDPILTVHGLSYRFRVSSEVNHPVRVTCVVSHREGHFEETTLAAGRDDSGKKNAIQQVGSTITYLQRYTLKAALGLAAAQDDDGNSSEAAAEPEAYTPPEGSITQQQADELRDGLEAKGVAPRAFLNWTGQQAGKTIDRIEAIPAGHFLACKAAIAKHQGGQK